MGIQHSQRSAYVQEMQKWELRPVIVDGETMIMPLPGTPPYVPEEHPYPKMLFRAEVATESALKHCIVNDESEERLQIGQGWSDGQQAALDAAKARQTEVATIAANRAFHEQRMSPKARAEAQAIVERKAQHLGEIPATPIRKRVKRATGK